METFDPDEGAALKATFEAMSSEWEGVTEEAMFGHPTYKASGTIFALLTMDGVVLTRLPDDERERLAEARDAGPFEANGQTIEKWVHVPIGADDLDAIEDFVRASHRAALGESRVVPPPDEE